jgi:hypothetical protein
MEVYFLEAWCSTHARCFWCHLTDLNDLSPATQAKVLWCGNPIKAVAQTYKLMLYRHLITVQVLLHVCAGSSRLYEDPDVDEYSSMDDTGYIRRSITNQQDFVVSELDFLRVSTASLLQHI